MTDEESDAVRDPQVVRLEGLYSAVVADCLDKLGARHQAMAPRVRPLYPQARVAGRAVTVRCVSVDTIPSGTRTTTRASLKQSTRLRPGT